jgi:hypothetical protein
MTSYYITSVRLKSVEVLHWFSEETMPVCLSSLVSGFTSIYPSSPDQSKLSKANRSGCVAHACVCQVRYLVL